MEKPVVEMWAEDEYRDGVSAGAAARELCRMLGASGHYPTLQRMLEDLLAAAFNDAREKADAASNEEMGKMTSGLPLPPGFKLPF